MLWENKRLRITAQLNRSADGFHIWSETYDGVLKDLFDLQESISRSITETLMYNTLAGGRGLADRQSGVSVFGSSKAVDDGTGNFAAGGNAAFGATITGNENIGIGAGASRNKECSDCTGQQCQCRLSEVCSDWLWCRDNAN